MAKLFVVLIAGALLVALSAAVRGQVPGGGSDVIRGDLPTSVGAGEYEMESLVEGNARAVKQVDKVKLEVDGEKIAGKYLATQSGNGMDSKFAGTWAKGNPAILMLDQSSADGYHAYYLLRGTGPDTFSGTWEDNQGHAGPVKITLKAAAEK
jgi:hypothetical protein